MFGWNLRRLWILGSRSHMAEPEDIGGIFR